MARGFLAASFVALLALSSGCVEDPIKLRFDVEKTIDPQTIEGGIALCNVPVVVDVFEAPFAMSMSQETDFPEQDTDVQHIETARLRRLDLSLTSATVEPDWDFLTSLSIFIEAENIEPRLLASIGEGTESGKPIPEGATTLELEPESVNMAKFIKANGGFTLTADATGCQPEGDAVFDGDVKVHIVADPV